MMRHKLLTGVAVLSGLGGALAQGLQPIDPLERPRTGAGSTSFSVGAGYSPLVSGGLVSVGGGIGAGVSHNVTANLAVSASTGYSAARLQLPGEDGVFTRTVGLWNGLNLGAQYTLPGGYAPALGLSVDLPLAGNPWAVTGSVSASVLRDPVILDGTLAVSYLQGEGPLLSAGAGLGFVVNEAVTLRFDTTQNLSVGQLLLPSGNLSLGLAYRVDGQQSLTARSTVSFGGGGSHLGVGLGYVYRR